MRHWADAQASRPYPNQRRIGDCPACHQIRSASQSPPTCPRIATVAWRATTKWSSTSDECMLADCVQLVSPLKPSSAWTANATANPSSSFSITYWRSIRESDPWSSCWTIHLAITVKPLKRLLPSLKNTYRHCFCPVTVRSSIRSSVISGTSSKPFAHTSCSPTWMYCSSQSIRSCSSRMITSPTII